MSLSRTALRLATILAISDKGDGSAEAATLAGARVHDTLMEPEHLFGLDRPSPIVVVYTDDDEGTNQNVSGGAPNFARTVNLTLELACATTRQVKDEVLVELPQTDAELEAILDLLEYQIRFALLNPASKWALLWGRLTRGIETYSSSRVMDSRGEARMAARTVIISARVMDDCPPQLASGESVFAMLPGPLQLVAEAVEASTGGNAATVKDVVNYLMKAGIPVASLLPMLATVDLTTHAGAVVDGHVGVVETPIEDLNA